jgi:hypothetical protein
MNQSTEKAISAVESRVGERRSFKDLSIGP